MARITYELDSEKITETVVEPNFLLTNKIGGYFLDYKSTKYRGFFSPYKTPEGWSLMKSIDTISITSVAFEHVNKLFGYEKHHTNGAIEKFFIHQNSLVYDVENYNGTSLLTLDVRDVNDFETMGKKYTVSKDRDFVIIKYAKDKLARYIAIKTTSQTKAVDKWTEHKFNFDEKRANAPFSWFVYESLVFNITGKTRIVMTTSDDKEKAIAEANSVYYSAEMLKSEKDKNVKKIISSHKQTTRKIEGAYKCSLKALDDLIVNIEGMKGIYAGLPWFYQIWTRDEAISLGALIKEKKYDIVKEILLERTKNILADGRISNRTPSSGLGSADGVGWVFKRFHDYFKELEKYEMIDIILTKQEIATVNNKLKESLDKIFEKYVKQGIILNRKQETWMDTDFGNDPRDGARIEIQTLTLLMIKTAKELCAYISDPDFKKYEKMEADMKESVRKYFFNNNFLNDGYNDPTVRPNIFLAYYVYPELLKENEWILVFRKALDKLWLEWGGLSTIDKTSPLFCAEYTGMNDKSYHRGDSWYWINNLAAICLFRADKNLFQKYITKIMEASTEEILRMGALGCHAEVSSAKEQRSEGCISQAWSSAMYIELVNEMFK